MNTKNQKNTDHHDRLLDTALREVVGQETPPDLAKKILAAASETSQPLATLGAHSKEKLAMSMQQRTRRKRNFFIGAVLAASLLVGAMITLPAFQARREAARRSDPVAHTAETKEPANRKDVFVDRTIGRTAKKDLPSQARTAVTTPDQGTVLFSTKPKGEAWRQIIDQNKNEKLMMAVTPHIIIQEEEEERLGISSEGVVPPNFSVDLDKPYRNSSFGLTVPQFDKGHPSAGNGVPQLQPPAQTGKETFSFSMGFGRGAKRQIERWGYRGSGGYGGEMGGYGGESPTTAGKPLGWRGSKEAATGPHSGHANPAFAARHREVSQELRKKIEKYQTLASELGGAESPGHYGVLNMLINDVRQTQGKILKAKEELVEINVNRAVAEQQTRSPSALEQAVAQALDKDPMIANYKADEFALMSKIRSAKSSDGQVTSAELKRLMLSLGDLQQESQKYRMVAERDTRTALKSTPNDHISAMTTEYLLRRNATVEKIAKLEKQYESKVAEIERKGERSGQLSLLEAEIEQLQQVENALESQRRMQIIQRQKALDPDQGPDASGDQYTRIYENPFIAAEGEQAVSTFSIDVDTASYANVRQFLMQSGQLPPPDAVRIEELVNYFSYDYTAPTDDTPFAAHVEVAGCPWHPQHRLVRVGIKGHEIANERRPQSNLVFLIDVSGSMNQPNKLPLLVEGLKMLTRQLGENDRVAIVVYASSEGLALPSTRGDQQAVILAALEKLRAGGSTAGGAGIQLAYKIAQENFIEGGVNRVILATDGDFNVGTTSTGELERLAETNARETGVFLTVLGFGRGNLNDAMMEAISGKGNGNYHYVDNRAEARKVLVEEIAGTLVTIAKDVKIQIEFNPAQVAAYRLIGYENRMLETQDFNDDKKDAGEIGAGHTVTAIYEVVPAGMKVETPKVDPLKYQLRAEAAEATGNSNASDELLTLKIRYKQPDGDKSTKLEFPITDNGQTFAEATDDFKFASAVASFGMLLRHSEHSGNASYGAVLEIAEDGSGKDLRGYRAEFLQLVRQAKVLAGE